LHEAIELVTELLDDLLVDDLGIDEADDRDPVDVFQPEKASGGLRHRQTPVQDRNRTAPERGTRKIGMRPRSRRRPLGHCADHEGLPGGVERRDITRLTTMRRGIKGIPPGSGRGGLAGDPNFLRNPAPGRRAHATRRRSYSDPWRPGPAPGRK